MAAVVERSRWLTVEMEEEREMGWKDIGVREGGGRRRKEKKNVKLNIKFS